MGIYVGTARISCQNAVVQILELQQWIICCTVLSRGQSSTSNEPEFTVRFSLIIQMHFFKDMRQLILIKLNYLFLRFCAVTCFFIANLKYKKITFLLYKAISGFHSSSGVILIKMNKFLNFSWKKWSLYNKLKFYNPNIFATW